jgi:hypothetical protein
MNRNFSLKLLAAMAIVMMLSLSLSLQAQVTRMPDLSILKITVDRDCNLAVVVRNNGPGMLPDDVYTNHHPKSAGVYVYINGKQWGGESIWKFDPGRKLQKPGGATTCILSYKVGPPITVKAVVDLWNDVKEANERNNTLSRRKLSCRPQGGTQRMPDLIVRDIKLIKDCKIEVTIKNIGTAGVPDSYYDLPDAVGVQMYNGTQAWGGIILKGFDPAGKLKVPGGEAAHVWFPLAANLNLGPGTHSIKVIADHGSVLPELNETNNTRTERLTCKKLTAVTGTAIATLARNSISNISFSPPSPASLDFDQRVNISFDYYATENVYIFARPMTKGSLTPNYAAHPSELYSNGNGKGTGFFTIKKGAVIVDQVRFQMKNKAQTKVLFETLVPVRYTFPKQTGGTTPQPASTPKRFLLHFKNAYLGYVKSSKSIQIIAEQNVLSYGGDWQKCQLTPTLFHLRENFWKGFYWEVNTAQKVVYRVKGGSFCKGGGTKEKLNMTVKVTGDYFYLYFSTAYLVYVPSTKTLQITTEGNVLSYGSDWQKCNLESFLYELKQNVWQGFYWKINTSTKQAWKITGAQFCSMGGTSTPLANTTVEVVY